MKVRIKATGEIMKLADYAKITLDVCDSYGNPIELKPEDVEFIKEENVKDNTIDWEQRRYEIAKDVYLLMLQWAKGGTTKEDVLKNTIKYTDVLIEELKANDTNSEIIDREYENPTFATESEVVRND